MSYCRWSTDDFRCDLYAYESVDGTWTTHVSRARYVGDPPHVPPLRSGEDADAWREARAAQTRWLETADRVEINLDHAGKTFKDPDLESFLATLLHLRAVGYCFPDDVLEKVSAEIADQSASKGSDAAQVVGEDSRDDNNV